MMMPMASAGRPTWVNTMASVTIDALGTPTLPTVDSVAMSTMVARVPRVSSIPKAWAMNTVATACVMAEPSILTVAPRGSVKELTRGSTPQRLMSSSATGSVALLLAVENAMVMAREKLRMKCRGLQRAANTSRLP